MKLRFDGRVAIVTGAGSGLGREYALGLAARGAKVVVNDLGCGVGGSGSSRSLADQVVAEIVTAGGSAMSDYGSVASDLDARAMVECAVERFGGLDIIVNNAGILRGTPFAHADLRDYEAMVGVHLIGSMLVIRAAIPHMQRRNYGRIIITSSSAGLARFNAEASYGAAKTAMLGLMNGLINELGTETIKINTLVPSALTRMSSGLQPTNLLSQLKPSMVAPMVLWLASDTCDVTGRIMVAGGGYFGRLDLVKSNGRRFDTSQPITPEMVAEAMPEIADMAGATQFKGTMENLQEGPVETARPAGSAR